ncbi:MAG: hypothetical protein JXR95_13635 [Deltaproteobacteria bacterium]|nr:hypothetical protein [Deltaproteobacteria bacterium]
MKTYLFILLTLIPIYACSNCKQQPSSPSESTEKVDSKKVVKSDSKKATAFTDKKTVTTTEKNTTAEKPQKNVKPVPVTTKPAVIKKVDPAAEDHDYWKNGTGVLKEKYAKAINAVSFKPTGANPKEHYYVSNEDFYGLWYPYVENLGGAYIGVASDQNYTLAVKSGAKLVFLIDYDYEVNRTHQLFQIMVELSKTPEEFMELLKRKYNRKITEIAKSRFDIKTAKFISYLHRNASGFLKKHHRNRIRNVKRKLASPYWLTDQKLFDGWKKLVTEKRVFILPGNLIDGDTIMKIGTICKQIHIPVSVIYFSNAEEFWVYPDTFKKAYLNLPLHEKAIILRTVVLGKKFKKGWKFHYTIQSGSDFAAWMKKTKSFSSKHMARGYRKPIEKLYFSRIGPPPAKGI